MNTTLYRPIGIGEYKLIKEADYREFPPRLEWQPIFYPVLNKEYAEQIAHDWNTKDEFSGFCGLVTSFDLNTDFLKKYPVQNVGGTIHNELWISAEELNAFNTQIKGEIKVVNAFFGEEFSLSNHREMKRYFDKLKKQSHD